MSKREFVRLYHPETGQASLFDAVEKDVRLAQGYTLAPDVTIETSIKEDDSKPEEDDKDSED